MKPKIKIILVLFTILVFIHDSYSGNTNKQQGYQCVADADTIPQEILQKCCKEAESKKQKEKRDSCEPILTITLKDCVRKSLCDSLNTRRARSEFEEAINNLSFSTNCSDYGKK